MSLLHSSSAFIQLASPHLQSLDYKEREYELESPETPFVMLHILKLTALTKLELDDLGASPSVDLKPLQNMGLLELRLENCSGLAEKLIVPRFLSSLQKLHLQDELLYYRFWGGGFRPTAAAAHSFESAVRSLPNLVELSGMYNLLEKSALERWKGWECYTPALPGELGPGSFWRKL